jgi:hypothetical protein
LPSFGPFHCLGMVPAPCMVLRVHVCHRSALRTLSGQARPSISPALSHCWDPPAYLCFCHRNSFPWWNPILWRAILHPPKAPLPLSLDKWRGNRWRCCQVMQDSRSSSDGSCGDSSSDPEALDLCLPSLILAAPVLQPDHAPP